MDREAQERQTFLPPRPGGWEVGSPSPRRPQIQCHPSWTALPAGPDPLLGTPLVGTVGLGAGFQHETDVRGDAGILTIAPSDCCFCEYLVVFECPRSLCLRTCSSTPLLNFYPWK